MNVGERLQQDHVAEKAPYALSRSAGASGRGSDAAGMPLEKRCLKQMFEILDAFGEKPREQCLNVPPRGRDSSLRTRS